MAGHSKWSKVNYIKGPLELKRGQLFSRLAKEITVAARLGGGDLSRNPRLRSLVLTARAQALMLGATFENRNRAAADLRLIPIEKHGSFASPGAVSSMFHRKGRVTVPAAAMQEGRLFDLEIEADGEELTQEDELYVITTAAHPLYAVAKAPTNALAPLSI
jgi:transcriptional/translational regulatory protein YebC/TACO1